MNAFLYEVSSQKIKETIENFILKYINFEK